MKRIVIAAAALVVTVAGDAAAQADLPRTAAVSYADLDLSRPGGRQVLEQRIQAAISRVCADQPRPLDLDGTHMYQICRRQAWAGAKRQLAEIYRGAELAQASIGAAPAQR